MCLSATRHFSENTRKRICRNGGKITVYKVVKLKKNNYKYSLYTPYYGNEVSKGWLVSDRKPEKISFRANVKKNPDFERCGYFSSEKNSDTYGLREDGVYIDKGIHVFLTEDVAKSEAACFNKLYSLSHKDDIYYCYIACEGHLEDFVAAGEFKTPRDSAVFMKIFVPTKEYNKVMKKCQKRKTKRSN